MPPKTPKPLEEMTLAELEAYRRELDEALDRIYRRAGLLLNVLAVVAGALILWGVAAFFRMIFHT